LRDVVTSSWEGRSIDKEASQTRDYSVAKRDSSRGSPRSFVSQKALTQDDSQTD